MAMILINRRNFVPIDGQSTATPAAAAAAAAAPISLINAGGFPDPPQNPSSCNPFSPLNLFLSLPICCAVFISAWFRWRGCGFVVFLPWFLGDWIVVQVMGIAPGGAAAAEGGWNEAALSLLPPPPPAANKRLKEQELLINSQISSAAADFPQNRPVSTGLGLSLDDRRLAAASSPGDSPPLFLMLDDEIDRELRRQEAELDRFIKMKVSDLLQQEAKFCLIYNTLIRLFLFFSFLLRHHHHLSCVPGKYSRPSFFFHILLAIQVPSISAKLGLSLRPFDHHSPGFSLSIRGKWFDRFWFLNLSKN